jgi:hypothetical protein
MNEMMQNSINDQENEEECADRQNEYTQHALYSMLSQHKDEIQTISAKQAEL